MHGGLRGPVPAKSRRRPRPRSRAAARPLGQPRTSPPRPGPKSELTQPRFTQKVRGSSVNGGGDRLHALQRGAWSPRAGRVRAPSRGGRLRLRLDLGPLPPLGRQAGQFAPSSGRSSEASRRRRSAFASAPASPARRLRIHPAIIAQPRPRRRRCCPADSSSASAAARTSTSTSSATAGRRPRVRQEMLEEAIEVIRLLWEGGLQSHHGKHYTVENARLYTLPEEPPPIIVAAAGPRATEMAGRIGDGLFGLVPDPERDRAVREGGGTGKPRFGQLHVCWAASEKEAKATAREWWPNAAVSGNLNWELPLPSHFEDASEWADEDAVAESVVCGPDPERHVEAIKRVRRCRLRQRLLPPGRPRPGGIPRLRRGRAPASIAIAPTPQWRPSGV